MNNKFMKRENRRNIAGSVSQTSERGDMGKYLNNSESCDMGKKIGFPPNKPRGDVTTRTSRTFY